jgi:hypothetical protein
MEFIWKTEAWYALYIPVWLWLVTTYVLLVRRPLGDGHHPKGEEHGMRIGPSS